MNKITIKRVIKRQFNDIIDEERKLRMVLAMKTNKENQRPYLAVYILESSST